MFRRPLPKLGSQMSRLKNNLSFRDRNAGTHLGRKAEDPAPVEGIAPSLRFAIDLGKKRADGNDRVFLRTEPLELWVVAVTLGESPQDLLCQQPLTPNSRQAFHIQITRVEGPKSHAFILPLSPIVNNKPQKQI